jgi:preprotein translocase subunit Sss1
MYKITMFLGALLSLIGLISYAISAFEHITAALPLILGLPIIYCGWESARSPEKRKLLMHIALTCALILFLGSFVRIVTMGSHPDRKELNKVFSLWGTTVITFVLIGIYVQSFLAARGGKSIPPATPESEPEAPAEPKA